MFFVFLLKPKKCLKCVPCYDNITVARRRKMQPPPPSAVPTATPSPHLTLWDGDPNDTDTSLLDATRFPSHCTTLQYIAAHDITLQYITLHYIAINYRKIKCMTIHYSTLRVHYSTSHYITLLDGDLTESEVRGPRQRPNATRIWPQSCRDLLRRPGGNGQTRRESGL